MMPIGCCRFSVLNQLVKPSRFDGPTIAACMIGKAKG